MNSSHQYLRSNVRRRTSTELVRMAPAARPSLGIALGAQIRTQFPNLAVILCQTYLEAGLPMEAAWRSALADYFCSFSPTNLSLHGHD